MRARATGTVLLALLLLFAPTHGSEDLLGDDDDRSASPVRRKPTRRGPIVQAPILEAQEAFAAYLLSCNDGQEQCRHNFIIEQLKPLFKEGVFGSLNTWLGVAGSEFELSARNVILQSGTAVWIHGCREDHMTNDADAWLAPAPPLGIQFNKVGPNPFTFGVSTSDHETVTWNAPFAIRFQPDDIATFEERVETTDGSQWQPIQAEVSGYLARIEYLRNGEVLFYLLEYDSDTHKAGGTKHPRIRIRPGQVDYSPFVYYSEFGTYRQQTFELDLYTPFGALDGDYQWPWTESAAHLKRNPPPVNQVPVIPKHVAIVQKLKLYFDCFVDKRRIPHEPHRVKHDPENPYPSTEFFKKNFDKMVQDLDDLDCLCGKCKSENHRECMSLCSVVQVITSGVAIEILPDKQKLFEDYQKALGGLGLPLMGHALAKRKRGLAEEDQEDIVERLTYFRDVLLPRWGEVTLIAKFKTSGYLDSLIQMFAPTKLFASSETVDTDDKAVHLSQLEHDIDLLAEHVGRMA